MHATQRRVQHGSALASVDGIAAKHCVNPAAQMQLVGQFTEALDDILRDSLTRVIEQQSQCLQ
jgi:hypothetical protein